MQTAVNNIMLKLLFYVLKTVICILYVLKKIKLTVNFIFDFYSLSMLNEKTFLKIYYI